MKKVKDGDELVLPAGDFNAFVHAARAHRQDSHSVRRAAVKSLLPSGAVMIHNQGTGAIARGDVLGIEGVAVDPLVNPHDMVLSCGAGPVADRAREFVIAQESIEPDAVGVAQISGLVYAQVNIVSEADGYADVVGGVLQSGAGGAARIVWKDAGTGVQLALIKLGILDGRVSVSDGKIWPDVADLTADHLHGKLQDYSLDDTYADVAFAEQNEGGNEQLKLMLKKSTVEAAGGIDFEVTHRIRISDGVGVGTCTFSSEDRRGRPITFAIAWRTNHAGPVDEVEWSTSGPNNTFFGEDYNWAGTNGLLFTAMPARDIIFHVEIETGTGHLLWTWTSNGSGDDVHAIVHAFGMETKTIDDYVAS